MVVSPHETALALSMKEQLVDDVTQIVQRVRYVECAPTRLWEAGLVSELADAVDRLADKVAKLQEAQGADR
jgi:hypothetical protein